MKKILLSMAAISMAAVASAQVADGQYLIRNVEQNSWLNSGHSWGTAAVTTQVSRVFEVVNQTDGTAKIKSTLGWWKGGDEIYLDGGENDAANFEFVKSGDKYFIKHSGKYFALNEKFDFKDGDWWNWKKACHQDTQWTIKLVSAEADATAWDVISLAEMNTRHAAATEANPTEASYFIKANNMQRNDSDNLKAWVYTVDGAAPQNVDPGFLTPDPNWIYGDDDAWAHQDTFGLVIYDNHEGTDMVQQVAEGLPAGKYNVTYRVVNQTSTPFELSINGTVLPVAEFADSDLWYGSAADALKGGEKTGQVTVGADGKLDIKMVKQSKADTQNRFAFKTFRLNYLGGSGSGIEGIEADENAPVEYYNLQGVRVANPANGIFIKKQGNKVSKVIR